MLDYSLAKQLKDAGFKQPIKPEERLPVAGIYTQMGSEGEPAYVPTLSELIEACGEGFFSLDRTPNGDWIARGISSLNGGTENAVRANALDIAVAHLWLWLALNKNQ